MTKNTKMKEELLNLIREYGNHMSNYGYFSDDRAADALEEAERLFTEIEQTINKLKEPNNEQPA